jgi:hypothetical protein
MYKTWESSLRRFSQIWLQTTNKAQSFDDPSSFYVWLYNENHMYESGNFLTFFFSLSLSLSLLGTENMQKHVFSFFFSIVFWIHFLAIYVQYAKVGDITAGSN